MIEETVVRSLVNEPVALRSAGDYITNDIVVPADAPDGSLLRIIIDLKDADRVNPAITVKYHFERRLGPEWRLMCGGTWVGLDEQDSEFGGPLVPRCYVALVTGVADGQGGRTTRNKRGWRVRGRIEVSSPLEAGCRIDVVTQL
jgi:hypothetical protein